MRTDLKIKKYPKKYWLVPIITFIAAILIQFFLQDLLYNKSIEVIVKTQNRLNDALKCDGSDKKCAARDIIFWVFYALTGNYFYFVFLGLIYNFVNVYKAFVLALSIYIGNLVSALMGLIYHAPRPFMVNYNIVPYIKVGEWGQPNSSLIVAIAFNCTLYKVIAKHRPLKGKVCAKIFIGAILFIYCAIVTLIIFAGGMITFDQMIVSILLGITVYLAMFLIFKIKVNNAAQFYGIIRSRFIYYFVLNLVLIIFLVILYRYINYEEDRSYYSKHLKKQFRRFNLNYIDENFFLSFTLSEGTFTNALCYLSNIIAVIALKIEMIITYDKDFDSWKKDNFDDKKATQSNSFGLLGEYKAKRITQWNHTNFFKTLVRCLICLVLSLAPLLLFLIPITKIPTIIRFLLFSFLLYCYYSFAIFYLFKKIYIFLGLNNKVFVGSSYDDN